MTSKIEQQVMASVGTIYVARQLVSATALKLYVCAAALWTLGRLVFVEQVFANWAHTGVGNSLNFVASAILSAELAVQATLALLLVAGLWFVRDLVSLKSYKGQTFA